MKVTHPTFNHLCFRKVRTGVQTTVWSQCKAPTEVRVICACLVPEMIRRCQEHITRQKVSLVTIQYWLVGWCFGKLSVKSEGNPGVVKLCRCFFLCPKELQQFLSKFIRKAPFYKRITFSADIVRGSCQAEGPKISSVVPRQAKW